MKIIAVNTEHDPHPGRISAMPACARAEKQNKLPPRIEPNARARKDITMEATISKTFENSRFRAK